MNIDDYLKIQEEEFMEFGRDIRKIILVAAKNVNSLKSFYDRYGAEVIEYIDSKSYVVKREDGNFELFILGSCKQYRKRFEQFLVDYYDIPKTYKLPAVLNVDHVFNKERAKNYYIRMILLDEKANKAWGRAYEKTSSSLDKASNNLTTKDFVLLDYCVFLKILEFPSLKKGDIKSSEDISKIAEESFSRLENLFGSELLSEPIKAFYRAEINRLVTGVWQDPEYKPTKILSYDDTDKLQDLKETIICLLKSNSFGIDDEDIIEGKYICANTSDKEKCAEILSGIDKARDIDWELLIKDKTLTSMIVRLYFKDDAQRYDIFLKKSVEGYLSS